MPKARGVEGNETEGLHQRVDAPVPEAESGSTLLLDNDGLGDGVKVVVADPAVVAQMFDAQETSVGGKADLPQGGQIGESPTDFKVVRIVDRRFGPERLTFLVVLLDPGFFVVDVERGDHAVGEDPGAELARGPAGDAAMENQLHLIGPADVEILADDFLEETATGVGAIEHLRQRKFGLEDGELIAIASAAVGGGKGMRHPAEPLAKHRVDLRRVQGIREALHATGIRAGSNAVVEWLVGDPSLRELPFEPFVAIETELRRVGKVRAELDEQWTEVAVQEIDIVVVDGRLRADDPRIARAVGPPALLGAEDTVLLLRLADKEDPFVAGELGQVLVRDVVFPLPLFERDEIDALRLGEALHGVDKSPTHLRDHDGRRNADTELRLQEVHKSAAG